MNNPVQEVTPYKLINATGNVMPMAGALLGIFVSSATSGTLTIYDSKGTGTTNKVVDTFSVSPGTFYPLPFLVTEGLYIVIGGTVTCTVSCTP